MLRKLVSRLNARLNPPTHDPLAEPLIDAFGHNGIRLPLAIVGSPPLSMHVTMEDDGTVDITLTYSAAGLPWWEGIGVGGNPREVPVESRPLGPRHESAGSGTAEEKADEIQEWLREKLDSVPSNLRGYEGTWDQ